MTNATRLPVPRGNAPLCACGCGNRTSTIRTEYILGHRPPRDPQERFWEKVDRRGPGQCWPWKASLKPNGYATFTPANGEPSLMAHRYAWQITHGPLVDGLTIDHLCRNRACMNPGHMEPVTRGENARRGGGWIRSAEVRTAKAEAACPQGHPRTPEHAYREGRSWRCRTCRNARRRKEARP